MSVSVRCFPTEDERFRSDVERQIGPLGGAIDHDGLGSIQECLEALRETYPLVRVRLADSLASVDPNEVVVYVFRDGSAVGAAA